MRRTKLAASHKTQTAAAGEHWLIIHCDLYVVNSLAPFRTTISLQKKIGCRWFIHHSNGYYNMRVLNAQALTFIWEIDILQHTLVKLQLNRMVKTIHLWTIIHFYGLALKVQQSTKITKVFNVLVKINLHLFPKEPVS